MNSKYILVLVVIALNLASAFDLSADDNVVVYWGQNGSGEEGTLASYCADSTYDVIILAFVDMFFDSRSTTPAGIQLPNINLAWHCGITNPTYPNLLQCANVAADIQSCQAAGKKIMLSLGGAAGIYGFTSEALASQFANTVWNMFLGGNDPAYPKVFPGAVLDGVDLDIEGGTTTYYANFVEDIRALYATDSSKPYYVSGAPQCVFPDAYLGPTPDTSALGASKFDFINIQFYNNYCGLDKGTNFNFDQWVSFFTSTTINQNIKLMVGAPAAARAAPAGGYVTIDNLQTILTPLRSNSYFGGVMLWDTGFAAGNIACGGTSNYGQCVSSFLKAK